MNTNFQGIYAVVVTPFNKDGSFDFDSAKKHLDWLIEKGVKAVCILGATGEYQSVTMEEHKAYVKEMVPYVCDRISVMVGATRERPEDVVELMENAKKYGAKIAMVLPSFYYHSTQEEVIAHYQYLNDHVDMPFVVYNNPGSCGTDLTPETYAAILKMKNAAVVKESTGDIRRLTNLIANAPENVSIFCGCDDLAYESFACGANGWISMMANFAPVDCVALYDCMMEKDFAKGMEIYKRMLPSLNTLESFPKTVQAIKYAQSVKGIPTGYARRPRIELTAEEKAFLDASMNLANIG